MAIANPKLDEICAQTAVPVNPNISLSLHPDQLREIGAELIDGEGGAAEAAFVSGRRALHALHEGLSAIVDAHVQMTEIVDEKTTSGGVRHLRVVPDNRKAELAAAIGARTEQIARTVDANMSTVNESIARLEQHCGNAIKNPKSSTADHAAAGAAIRRYVERHTGSENTEALMAIIADRDVEAIDAVASHSPFASGLSRAQHAMFVQQAQAALAPREWRQLGAARKVAGKIREAGGIYIDHLQKVLPKVVAENPREAALRKLKGVA